MTARLGVFDRFMAKVEKTDSCWNWKGTKTDEGYARLFVQGRQVRAHRWAYEHFVGPIPDGLILDHICHNNADCRGGDTCPHRACVNPAHLEPVTAVVNVLRGEGRTAVNARKTECIHGHEFTPENTRIYSGHKRKCRACQQILNRQRYPRREAA